MKVCGTTAEFAGSSHVCTVRAHPNHDMPGPDGWQKPHNDGRWSWTRPVGFIGPIDLPRSECGCSVYESCTYCEDEE